MIISRAPLRISLGGGGTDLPSYYSKYGGFCLSAAINKYIYIYVNRPSADEFIRVKYSRFEQVKLPDEVQHDLVKPALKELELGGSLEITSMADIPAGTGMGSSSTYIVALLSALHELKRERIPTQALAEQACHIEMGLAGHPAGKQDAYLAAFGGITCLDIDTNGKVLVTPLDISVTTAENFRNNILIFYTGITRGSTTILDAQRYDTSNGNKTIIDSLHRSKELGYEIKNALLNEDVERFGYLLHEHWMNKKKRMDDISNTDIDRWYDVARYNGALGGKIMGAGGGGFFMFYVPNKDKEQVRKAMKDEGLKEMFYDFDYEGTKVLINF
jgi:D-glycero-alpha-D-manno-heptose-7-phosphate kinase